MNRLQGHIVAIPELGHSLTERMFHLMGEAYENLDELRFTQDLSNKDHVILMNDSEGELQGFSTLKVYRETLGGKARSILYSGDTVINPSYWGGFELPRLWGAYAFSLMEHERSRECYWFLMTKGYKTYRFLPVFFNEFFPCFEDSSNPELSVVRDEFAARLFTQHYDPAAGVISFGGKRDHLRQGVADIEPARLKDPHVSHFLKLNPEWELGDELACIASLRESNFKKMGRKLAERELARQHISFDALP